MGSVVGGLLGGKPKSASQSTTVQVPQWLDAQNQALVKRAVTASKTPYEAFVGQRVAPLTQDTRTGMQLTRDNTGRYQGLLDQSSNLASMYGDRAASGPSATDIQNNMNPYIQNVLDIARRKIGEQSGQQLANQRSAAAKSNSFGGSRNALKESELFKNTAQLMSDTQTQGMSSAFDQAMAQWNQQNKDIMGASQNLGATATTNQGVNSNDVGNLLKSGEIERLVNQAGLDTEYENWDRERAYDYDNLNFLSNILNPQTSYYAGQQTSGTQSNGGGSTAGNALGAASSIASIVSMIPWSDERLKENIKTVGKLDNGLDVIQYNMKGDPKTVIGVSAQEVEAKNPDAVGELAGYKFVDYEKATQNEKNFAIGGGVTAQEKAKALRQAPSKGQVGVPSLAFAPDEEGTTGATDKLTESLTKMFGGGLGQQVTDIGGGENIIWNTDRAGQKFPDNPNITDFGGGEQILWGGSGGGMWDQISNGFSGLFSGFKGFADGGRVNDGPDRLVSPSEEQAMKIAELIKSLPALQQDPNSGALFETTPAPEVLLDQAPDMKTTDDVGFLDKIINNLNQSRIGSGPGAGPMLGKALETGRDAFSDFMGGFSGGSEEQLAATEPSGVEASAKLFSNAKAAQRNAAAVNAPAASLDDMLARAGAPTSQEAQYAQMAQPTATEQTATDPLMDLLKRRLLTKEVAAKEPTLSEILGAFGKGMLNTNGEERDFFQQLGMGQTSVDDLKASKLKGATEEEQSILASITEFLKTKAYIDQVAKQGQMTDYQKAQLEQAAMEEIGRNIRATVKDDKPSMQDLMQKLIEKQ
jgi:hypothetical protein